jgi:hypothetical protein
VITKANVTPVDREETTTQFNPQTNTNSNHPNRDPLNFHPKPHESNAKNHQPTCHLLVQAVEEECDVVLEAGDGSRDSGPAGSESGVRRSGVEAVGVGESGARHGARGALDLPRDLERAPKNPAA